jgi:hypothetical protein
MLPDPWSNESFRPDPLCPGDPVLLKTQYWRNPAFCVKEGRFLILGALFFAIAMPGG